MLFRAQHFVNKEGWKYFLRHQAFCICFLFEQLALLSFYSASRDYNHESVGLQAVKTDGNGRFLRVLGWLKVITSLGCKFKPSQRLRGSNSQIGNGLRRQIKAEAGLSVEMSEDLLR